MSGGRILPYGRYQVANRNYGLLVPGEPGGEIIMTMRPSLAEGQAQTILYTWNLERPGDFSIPESTFYVLKTEHGEGWLGKTSKPKHPTDTIEGLPVPTEWATIVTDKNAAWVFTLEPSPNPQGQSVGGKNAFRLVTINESDGDKVLLTVTNLTTDLLIEGVVQMRRHDELGSQENSDWELNLVLTDPDSNAT